MKMDLCNNVLMCNLLSLPIYQQLSLFMLLISLFIKVYVLVYMIGLNIQGRIQDFKLGGAHLKNCAERREVRNLFGYFV